MPNLRKLRKNLIFDRTSGLKLEMKSYSDNAYDVTISCCFERFMACTLFLPSFIAVRHQMAELNVLAFLPPPPAIIGVSRTVQNRVNCGCAKVKSIHYILVSLGPLLNLDLYHFNCLCHPQSNSIRAGNYLR